ncbi:hypothetical protein BRM1_05805 [Brevibacterium sp. BRM-1]|uniref:hypothetical protein n=1 Tax=Brevibacterium sp. BRM-1 TaxID=2999062 RepID=UPI00228079D2|nr:hypothetical protein [Brevibacterium sp. BRM-1]WAL41355.1 hypothetical protein BRM1_05805 [Brevibacterium sp. BRM-1]
MKQTTIGKTDSKGIGSGKWGYVGDVKTQNPDGKTTYPYGVNINPSDGSLWVSDSGKTVTSRFSCALAGFPGTSRCQTGVPQMVTYAKADGTEQRASQYTVDGDFAVTAKTAISDDWKTKNTGLGALFAARTEARTKKLVDTETDKSEYHGDSFHGPRGIAFDGEGNGWVTDSDDLASPQNPVAVKIFDKDLDFKKALGGNNYGQFDALDNANSAQPMSIATRPNGNMLVASQSGKGKNRLIEYKPDGTFVGTIPLDLPEGSPGLVSDKDTGARTPRGVSVNPKTGHIFVAPMDGSTQSWVGQGGNSIAPFIVEYDEKGAFVQNIGQGDYGTRQAMFGSRIDPKTQEVWAWSADGGFNEYKADGTLVKKFTDKDFYGLEHIRGLVFDSNGRVLARTKEGSNSKTALNRVMMLGQTPNPTTEVSGTLVPSETPAETAPASAVAKAARADADEPTCGVTSPAPAAPTYETADLDWANASVSGALPYRQTEVRDFSIEARMLDADDQPTSDWKLVDHSSATSELGRDGVKLPEPLKAGSEDKVQFRVAAWNEAGNGDTGGITLQAPPAPTAPAPTPCETPSDAPSPSDSASPSPSDSVSPSPSESVSPSPSDSTTPSPSASVTPSPSDSVTPSPSDSQTPEQTDTTTPSETSSASATPSASSTPTKQPSRKPSPAPSTSSAPAPGPNPGENPGDGPTQPGSPDQPNSPLPRTGAEIAGALAAAALLIGGGVLAVTAGRRRSRK